MSKNVLLMDANNLMVRCFFLPVIGPKEKTPDYRLWKSICIDSIFRMINITKATEVVLAIDSTKSWRKLYWERYKESRKGKRDESGVDWQTFFGKIDEFTEQIQTCIPFKIIRTPNAEADDTIAVLCMDRRGPVYTIVSTDEDYLQLCSANTKIYHPFQRKFIVCQNPATFVIDKCLLGQPKDDIFNIRTPLDYPSEKRKPPFGKTQLKKVHEVGYKQWLRDHKLEERFHVNKVLIDFTMIPKSIRSRILGAYDNYQLPDPSNMYGFFKTNHLQAYIEDFTKIESKLYTFY